MIMEVLCPFAGSRSVSHAQNCTSDATRFYLPGILGLNREKIMSRSLICVKIKLSVNAFATHRDSEGLATISRNNCTTGTTLVLNVETRKCKYLQRVISPHLVSD